MRCCKGRAKQSKAPSSGSHWQLEKFSKSCSKAWHWAAVPFLLQHPEKSYSLSREQLSGRLRPSTIILRLPVTLPSWPATPVTLGDELRPVASRVTVPTSLCSSRLQCMGKGSTHRRDEVGGRRRHRGSGRGGGESQGFGKDCPHHCIARKHQANTANAKQHRQL